RRSRRRQVAVRRRRGATGALRRVDLQRRRSLDPDRLSAGQAAATPVGELVGADLQWRNGEEEARVSVIAHEADEAEARVETRVHARSVSPSHEIDAKDSPLDIRRSNETNDDVVTGNRRRRAERETRRPARARTCSAGEQEGDDETANQTHPSHAGKVAHPKTSSPAPAEGVGRLTV